MARSPTEAGTLPVMASKSDEAQPRRSPGPSRWLTIGVGIVLGFVWGTIMWGVMKIAGREVGGAAVWLYLAISTAMIGGGVAAVFGAGSARKRGERIGPRIRRR